MKRKILGMLTIVVLLSSLLVAATPVLAEEPDGASPMPPSEFLIIRALKARGVIPGDATEMEAWTIYQAYIQQKLGQGEDHPNPLGAAHLKKGEASGHPKNNHGRIMRPNNQRFDNVLTLLVEFAGTDDGHTGPLHNEIAPPAPDDNTTFWVEDFNREHYQNMLFDMSPGVRSMSNFYLEQSGHKYTVEGQVYGWVAVDHSEWWYGADGPTEVDNLNGPVWRVVQDTVVNACDVPWAQFDTEDPYDLDGDGNYAEPDGYVDHIQLVHAGAGQEAGGGAQGDDAIWAHSWWADFGSHGPGYGGVPTCDPNVWVGPYTINPEDGTIGVFVHEFGHDLGLPDLYDTIGSGEASTGYWTLMSAGSWLACPGEALGTCPANMGVWEKYVLGWVDPVVVNPGEMKNNILLKSAETAGPAGKAILVNLPSYSEGEAEIETFHYYLAEWRTLRGFDVSMATWYNWIDLYAGQAETFSASPGMLLWYRNGQYGDNWVGVHPWAGAWLIVDAHPDLVLADDLIDLANALFDPNPNMGLPFRTRIQIADATFGLDPTPEQPITKWELFFDTDSHLPALPGVPTFDDSVTYVDDRWAPWFYAGPEGWFIRNSISSVDTPTYGLKITVRGSNPNAGKIKVDFSGFTP